MGSCRQTLNSCINAVRHYRKINGVLDLRQPRQTLNSLANGRHYCTINYRKNTYRTSSDFIEFRRPSEWRFPRNRGEGCDFNHWQVWPRPMKGSPSKDDIINYYISVLAQVLGSEEEAIHRIYSVATRKYYAFGVNVDAKLGNTILASQNVCFLLPDLYVDPIEKRYPWDPFINGQALSYDSKYYPPSKFPRYVVTDEQLDHVCSRYSTREADDGIRMDQNFDLGRLPPGFDLEHWQIHLEPPLVGASSKDEIIQSYIKFLAQVLGSEEEAVKKIYSVATRHCYGFGANVSEEIADKIAGIENVILVLPDSYVDPVEKRYSWDAFINGQALPYDPKYYGMGDRSNTPYNTYSHGLHFNIAPK